MFLEGIGAIFEVINAKSVHLKNPAFAYFRQISKQDSRSNWQLVSQVLSYLLMNPKWENARLQKSKITGH